MYYDFNGSFYDAFGNYPAFRVADGGERDRLAVAPEHVDQLVRDPAHRFVVQDRDATFALAVDEAIPSMSVHGLRTSPRTRAPTANGVIGTARRERLDWVIRLYERHIRQTLAEWVSQGMRSCDSVAAQEQLIVSVAFRR